MMLDWGFIETDDWQQFQIEEEIFVFSWRNKTLIQALILKMYLFLGRNAVLMRALKALQTIIAL